MGGNFDHGLSAITESLAAYEALGARKTTWHLVTIADIFRLGGQSDMALAAVAEGLTVAAETGERHFEANCTDPGRASAGASEQFTAGGERIVFVPR